MRPPFSTNPSCTCRLHCEACRSTSATGEAWRRGVSQYYSIPEVCPHGVRPDVRISVEPSGILPTTQQKGKPHANLIAPSMEETGPSLWREIHCHRAADGSFIQRIDQQIPCGDCRRHWQALLQQRPPEFSEGWFAWTVWLHNEINARLNKPLMTVEEAQAIWA